MSVFFFLHLPMTSRLFVAAMVIATAGIVASATKSSDGKFTLMSPNPFWSATGSQRRPPRPCPKYMSELADYRRRHQDLPPVVNWVKRGAVTPVSDQGYCGGACVAFAITGNVEGVNFVTNRRLIPLSAQEIVSCAHDGCCGGWPQTSFDWLLNHTHGRLCTAASFPFNSSSGNSGAACRTNCTTGAIIEAQISIAQSEAAIATSLVMTGPVLVSVDASTWSEYTGGVMTNCTFQYLSHTAVAVGYDDTHHPPYWLIKNSWGTTWGEAGYIRIAKGSNQCGINQLPSTVRVRRA